MLVIRLQRTGRSGHAMFRMVVQDSRRTPKSGKVVAWLGSYDPHSKSVNIDIEKATKFIENGAQPSDRVISLLNKEGIKMPAWVSKSADRKREIRNPEKRRSTAPKEEITQAVEEPKIEPSETEVSDEIKEEAVEPIVAEEKAAEDKTS